MKIAIPTKGRADNQETLRLLYKAFHKDEIYLFVEPDEIDDYKRFGKAVTIVPTTEADRGISYARNAVIDYFDEPVFILDDDITQISMRLGRTKSGYPKLVKVQDKHLRIIFTAIENFARVDGCLQATISFQPSNWLHEGSMKKNTRVWCFNWLDCKALKTTGIRFDEGIKLFEDYDLTLQLLRNGFENISLYNYAFTCNKMGEAGGGCQTIRNRKTTEDSIHRMIQKWGSDIVKEFFSKEHNLPEIKINWKKAVQNGE